MFTDKFISASVGWRRSLFSSLWNSLEEKSLSVNSAAFTSVCVLQQPKEDLRVKLGQELHDCVVEENEGNACIHNLVQTSLPIYNCPVYQVKTHTSVPLIQVISLLLDIIFKHISVLHFISSSFPRSIAVLFSCLYLWSNSFTLPFLTKFLHNFLFQLSTRTVISLIANIPLCNALQYCPFFTLFILLEITYFSSTVFCPVILDI